MTTSIRRSRSRTRSTAAPTTRPAGPKSIAGTADDSGGSVVELVFVSIRNGATGKYWDGDGFDRTTEMLDFADGTTDWTYDLPGSDLTDGVTYTVRAQTIDSATNFSAFDTATFTYDTTPPTVTIDLQAASDSGASSIDDLTNAASLVFDVTFNERRQRRRRGRLQRHRQRAARAATRRSPWATPPTSTRPPTRSPSTTAPRARSRSPSRPTPPPTRPATTARRSPRAGPRCTIDRSHPTSAVTFPVDGAFYNAAGYTAGCGTPVAEDVCGTATDPLAGGVTSGVDAVEVAFQVAVGDYWSGAAFDSPIPVWFAATGTGSWTRLFAAADYTPDDDYTVHARATDVAGNIEANPSTSTFTIDNTQPTVGVDKALGQADPTNSSPIDFTVTFSEAVTDFDDVADVSFAGSSVGGTLVATITGGPSIYNVAVTGMSSNGNVQVSVPAASASDTAGNLNTASSAVDSVVAYQVVASTADLSISKSGPASVIAGQSITYDLTITNIGSSTATGVSVSDTLPAGLSNAKFCTHPTGGCTPGMNFSSPLALSNLTSGQTVQVKITATVDAGVTGSLSNTATVSASNDSNAGNDTSNTVVTTVNTQADLSVTKTGPDTQALDSEFEWTVTVTNDGPSNNAGFTLKDDLPVEVDFVGFGDPATQAGCTVPSGVGVQTTPARAQALLSGRAWTGRSRSRSSRSGPAPPRMTPYHDPTTRQTRRWATTSTPTRSTSHRATCFPMSPSAIRNGRPTWMASTSCSRSRAASTTPSRRPTPARSSTGCRSRTRPASTSTRRASHRPHRSPWPVDQGSQRRSTTVFLKVPSMPANIGTPNPTIR